MDRQLSTCNCVKISKQPILRSICFVGLRSAVTLFSLVTIFAVPVLSDQVTAIKHAERAKKYQALSTSAMNKGDTALACHYTLLGYEENLKAVRSSDDGLIPGSEPITTFLLKNQKDIVGSCKRMGHL
jgi:hypothetical protein